MVYSIRCVRPVNSRAPCTATADTVPVTYPALELCVVGQYLMVTVSDYNHSDREMKRTNKSSRQPCHTGTMDAAPDMTAETVFDVLAGPRRRAVLTSLRETTDGQTSVEKLAASLSDHPRLSLSLEEARLVLHHVVLPKLAEVGLIKHDTQAEIVRYVDHPRVEAALDLAADWEA